MFKKFNWGHGVAVALATFISFILFMVLVFPNGQPGSDLVSDSYYEDELVYQEVIDGKNNATQLAEQPVYTETPAGIKIEFPASISADANKVHFDLFRTDDANLDVKKDLTLDGSKSFTIPTQVISKGSYTLKLKWKQNKKPYQIDYDILWK